MSRFRGFTVREPPGELFVTSFRASAQYLPALFHSTTFFINTRIWNRPSASGPRKRLETVPSHSLLNFNRSLIPLLPRRFRLDRRVIAIFLERMWTRRYRSEERAANLSTYDDSWDHPERGMRFHRAKLSRRINLIRFPHFCLCFITHGSFPWGVGWA